MVNRPLAAVMAVALFGLQALPSAALADNQMDYQLLPADQAAALPRNGGKLGLNVGHGEQIRSSGLTFELLRVNSVAPGSPGAQAGFHQGDQIIAVDGRVFPNVASFAAYVGSKQPAQQISIDYLPPNGGPQDAQRVGVTLSGGKSSTPVPQPSQPAASTGLSTGTKVAIGVAAAALFGCYRLGCFSHKAGGVQQPATAKP